MRACTTLLIALTCLACADAMAKPAAYGSIYGNVKCSADMVLTPKSTGEVASALAMLYARKMAGVNVKVRATHE